MEREERAREREEREWQAERVKSGKQCENNSSDWLNSLREAAELYTSLPASVISDYQQLKQALLTGSIVFPVMRDSGCTGMVVSEEVLPDVDPALCPKVKVADSLGRIDEFPLVRCFLRCPYYTGWASATRAPLKFATVLIGNIPDAVDLPVARILQDADGPKTTLPEQPRKKLTSVGKSETISNHPITPSAVPSSVTHSSTTQVCAVQTRASQMKRVHSLVLSELHSLKVTP
ncbi:hypothetical protein E2C01_020373 [Portunus trituberculatus]|uniref:Uncharacterized protein n=1 Tax=Portunus trituberculatus TaxID=210409 RepID=A0A5B7E235_PORTR|nr:hypothetical protein [Portunus trituberculatus]